MSLVRVLFISRWFPFPPSNGSKLRVLGLLRGLAQTHEVTLLSFADQTKSEPTAPERLSLCREVKIVPWREFNPSGLKAGLGFLSPTPRSIVDTYSPLMERTIKETLASQRFDVVVASELGSAVYARCFGNVPSVFEEVEVAPLYERYTASQSVSERVRHGLTWAKHRRYLKSLLPAFASCTVVSERERRLLEGIAPGYHSVHVIPNCVDLPSYQGSYGEPAPGSIVFSGSFRYAPNYQAMIWYLEQVHPRVRSACPQAHLAVTGDHAGLPLPTSEGVSLTGFVDDVRPYVARSCVSVVPIREGGGTRLKAIEAMALGTPVVATSKGVEGLEVRDGEHLLIADTPEAFSRAVIRLLGDVDLRRRLASGGRELVRCRYDWAVVIPRFLDLVEVTARPDQRLVP